MHAPRPLERYLERFLLLFSYLVFKSARTALNTWVKYGPKMVELIGIEPMTPGLQSRCSPS